MPASSAKEKCFVIMPISDPQGYADGHFKKIYEQIFKPAIEEAGYFAHRVDYDKSSGLIQAKIIKDLVEAPMVLCDLSTRNPNVLFELGMRQAFDKPVVLVQEAGTERIFDISGISTQEYRKERIHDEVIEDRAKIVDTLLKTKTDGKFNSLINLIKINSAVFNKEPIADRDRNHIMLDSIMRQLNLLSDQVNDIINSQKNLKDFNSSSDFRKNNSIENEIRNVFRNYRLQASKLIKLASGDWSATAEKERELLYNNLDQEVEKFNLHPLAVSSRADIWDDLAGIEIMSARRNDGA